MTAMSLLRHLLVGALFCASAGILPATQNVTSITTNTVTGIPSSAEGYTFDNNQRALSSFTTAASTYNVSSISDNVFIRRNAVNNNQSSVWYVSSGVGTNLSGIHQSDYGTLLHSNNLFGGSDNTFGNGVTADLGNIERVDFTWNSALTVTNALAFAVFERGAIAVHDSFAIAAVTAIDASGNPTAYGALLKISAGWGGATNAGADFNYRLFRYNNGNVITATTDSSPTNTQGLGGIMISAADLGLTLGSTIYGYSLMAIDVTASTSAQLVDWTNGTFYPTTTDGATGGGGIDLAAVNGMAFSLVPEPVSNTIVISFLLLVCFCHFRRTRLSRS